jgi:ribosomal protein L40E
MADYVDEGLKRIGISISKPMLAIVCIVSGIMVILLPNLLIWIVGLFLVIQGALLLTDHFEQEIRRTQIPPKIVYCQNCGTRNTEEAIYCKKCGERLTQTEPIVTAQIQETVQ